MNRAIQVVCLAVLVGLGSAAMADINIETVPVGNVGNAADSTGYGAVNYEYNIGKYEVTAGQYTDFLNAVAKTDTYGLYNANMWSSSFGCKIQQTGSSGGYSYSVAGDYATRPVNYVSWYDALRFANWMTEGDTESGSYTITGGGPNSGTVTIPTVAQRQLWAAGSTRYVLLPSEDEWYKAAYYDPGKAGGAGYWDYPTASDTAPTAELPVGIDLVNGSANYWDGDYLDTTYYTTEVGAYTGKPSDSAYGTFDQGGNVWEWNEAIVDGSYRGLRGGAFEFAGYVDGYDLSVNVRSYNEPMIESYNIGFRVAEPVPVPGAAILGMIGIGMVGWWKRRSAIAQ